MELSLLSQAFSTDSNSLLATVNPLPPPEKVYQDAFGMAWPQVLAWCAAAAGALLVVMFIKYLRG